MFFAQIAGHLGKDPETRFTPSGQKVTSFNVAINLRKGKEDVTVWVRVTVWGDRLDKIISFLKKGSAVIVSGKMAPPSNYTDKEGRSQFTLELTAEMIEFSPFGKGDRGEQGGNAQGFTQQRGAPSPAGSHSYAHSDAHSQGGYGGSATGQGNSHQHNDEEDALPF